MGKIVPSTLPSSLQALSKYKLKKTKDMLARVECF